MGDLLGFTRNGSAYYYVRNGQNDIIGILNSAGQQVVSYAYDSWGKLLSVTGDEAETIGQLNPFRYRGYYYDTETGLYYLNSRYYDPACGRFLNADFALGVNEDLLSNNVFIYCSNNPVNNSDDSGCGKVWNWVKNTYTKAKNAVKSFFGFQSKVTTSVSEGEDVPKSVGIRGLLNVEYGMKSSITKTKGASKVVNFYTESSNKGVGVGVQTGNVSISRGRSSIGRRTTNISVVADKVVRTLSVEDIGLYSFSLTYSEMSLGESSSGIYITLNSNVLLAAGAAILVAKCVVIFGPVIGSIVSQLPKEAPKGGAFT